VTAYLPACVLLAVEGAELFLGNAGTAMRPLTAAVAAAGRGRFVLDGVARMRERPIQDLVDGLVQVGCLPARLPACLPAKLLSDGTEQRSDVRLGVFRTLLLVYQPATASCASC
jgi:5-enolpyruvylshikimate-3-phosphate synthase